MTLFFLIQYAVIPITAKFKRKSYDIDDSKSVVLDNGPEFVKVSVKDLKALKALKASINGDCYQGEDWELQTIDKMLNNI